MNRYLELIRRNAHIFSLAALMLCIPPVQSAAAGELVSCRYLQSSGSTVLLELTVASPPPASIIIVQNLPQGTDIIRATPPPQKHSKEKGEVKWLLKGVESSRQTISMTLEPPLPTGVVSGEIRYKNPESGKMVSMPVRP